MEKLINIENSRVIEFRIKDDIFNELNGQREFGVVINATTMFSKSKKHKLIVIIEVKADDKDGELEFEAKIVNNIVIGEEYTGDSKEYIDKKKLDFIVKKNIVIINESLAAMKIDTFSIPEI